MRMLALALLLCISFGKRKAEADAQLAAAKAAYEETLSKTGDFDCVGPEFDAVLAKFDAVPSRTAAKKEAQGLAQDIREKRAAASAHARAVDRAAAAPRVGRSGARGSAAAPAQAAPSSPPAGLPASGRDGCDAVRKRVGELRTARRKAGKPALGTMDFQSGGEVGFAPGAEPTPEEEQAAAQLKACNGNGWN